MTTHSNQASQDQTHLNEYGDAVIDDDCIIFDGKFFTAVGFFDDVKRMYMDIEVFLMRDVDYTAEDLCGQEFWEAHDSCMQRMAVMCLKHMTTLPKSRLHIAPKSDRVATQFRKH